MVTGVALSHTGGTGVTRHRLEVAHLSKTFGPARVLRDVQLNVAPGELHGLVGQNGCGKSTLVKILTGVYTPDPGGSIAVDGRRLRTPVQPSEQREVGVSVVHQHLGLVGSARSTAAPRRTRSRRSWPGWAGRSTSTSSPGRCPRKTARRSRSPGRCKITVRAAA
jgi:ABC-type cobalamin/Fe3+-siderophores transport system ATPase subunit